jgi:hypothetical protein
MITRSKYTQLMPCLNVFSTFESHDDGACENANRRAFPPYLSLSLPFLNFIFASNSESSGTTTPPRNICVAPFLVIYVQYSISVPNMYVPKLKPKEHLRS